MPSESPLYPGTNSPLLIPSSLLSEPADNYSVSPAPSRGQTLPESCELDKSFSSFAPSFQLKKPESVDTRPSSMQRSQTSGDENVSASSSNIYSQAHSYRLSSQPTVKIVPPQAPAMKQVLHTIVDQDENSTQPIGGTSRLLEKLSLSDNHASQPSHSSPALASPSIPTDNNATFNPHHRYSLPHLSHNHSSFGAQQQQNQLLLNLLLATNQHQYQQQTSGADSQSQEQRPDASASSLLLNPHLAQQLSLNGMMMQPQLSGTSIPKKISLYKTELCRTFEETGYCRYGTKCQFAHDRSELRIIPRHPRYKTEICRTFWEHGNCPYGKRCCFIHLEAPIFAASSQATFSSNNPTAEGSHFQRSQSLVFPSSSGQNSFSAHGSAFMPTNHSSGSIISPDLSNFMPPANVTSYTEAQDALTAFLKHHQQPRSAFVEDKRTYEHLHQLQHPTNNVNQQENVHSNQICSALSQLSVSKDRNVPFANNTPNHIDLQCPRRNSFSDVSRPNGQDCHPKPSSPSSPWSQLS